MISRKNYFKLFLIIILVLFSLFLVHAEEATETTKEDFVKIISGENAQVTMKEDLNGNRAYSVDVGDEEIGLKIGEENYVFPPGSLIEIEEDSGFKKGKVGIQLRKDKIKEGELKLPFNSERDIILTDQFDNSFRFQYEPLNDNPLVVKEDKIIRISPDSINFPKKFRTYYKHPKSKSEIMLMFSDISFNENGLNTGKNPKSISDFSSGGFVQVDHFNIEGNNLVIIVDDNPFSKISSGNIVAFNPINDEFEVFANSDDFSIKDSSSNSYLSIAKNSFFETSFERGGEDVGGFVFKDIKLNQGSLILRGNTENYEDSGLIFSYNNGVGTVKSRGAGYYSDSGYGNKLVFEMGDDIYNVDVDEIGSLSLIRRNEGSVGVIAPALTPEDYIESFKSKIKSEDLFSDNEYLQKQINLFEYLLENYPELEINQAYTIASSLEMDVKKGVYFSKLGLHGYALESASKSIDLDKEVLAEYLSSEDVRMSGISESEILGLSKIDTEFGKSIPYPNQAIPIIQAGIIYDVKALLNGETKNPSQIFELRQAMINEVQRQFDEGNLGYDLSKQLIRKFNSGYFYDRATTLNVPKEKLVDSLSNFLEFFPSSGDVGSIIFLPDAVDLSMPKEYFRYAAKTGDLEKCILLFRNGVKPEDFEKYINPKTGELEYHSGLDSSDFKEHWQDLIAKDYLNKNYLLDADEIYVAKFAGLSAEEAFNADRKGELESAIAAKMFGNGKEDLKKELGRDLDIPDVENYPLNTLFALKENKDKRGKSPKMYVVFTGGGEAYLPSSLRGSEIYGGANSIFYSGDVYWIVLEDDKIPQEKIDFLRAEIEKRGDGLKEIVKIPMFHGTPEFMISKFSQKFEEENIINSKDTEFFEGLNQINEVIPRNTKRYSVMTSCLVGRCGGLSLDKGSFLLLDTGPVTPFAQEYANLVGEKTFASTEPIGGFDIVRDKVLFRSPNNKEFVSIVEFNPQND